MSFAKNRRVPFIEVFSLSNREAPLKIAQLSIHYITQSVGKQCMHEVRV